MPSHGKWVYIDWLMTCRQTLQLGGGGEAMDVVKAMDTPTHPGWGVMNE